MTPRYSLYCLTFPNGKRYAGITKQSVAKRIRHHRWRASSRTTPHPLYDAMKKYGLEAFEVSIIEADLDEAGARSAERAFISAHHLCDRRHGYNVSPGGDGDTLAASEALKAMYADAAAKERWHGHMVQRRQDPQARAATGAQAAARWADPEFRERMRLLQNTPEYRAALRDRLSTPEVKAKKSKAATRQMADPAARLRIGEANRKRYASEEARRAMADRARVANARPETKEKQRAAAFAREARRRLAADTRAVP